VNAASLQQTVDCLTRAELSVAVYVQSAENKTTTFGCKLTWFFPPLKNRMLMILLMIFMLVLLRFDEDDHGVHAGCDEFD